MTIIPTIIEQHAEEAAFLWFLRDSAVSEPHYDLADLAHLDERVESHLDGLRIAGEPGWEICRQAMVIEEPGEIFTASVLAFESQVVKRIDAVLAMVENNAELTRALISALGWIAFERIADPVQKMLQYSLPFARHIGLAACAIHQKNTWVGLDQYMRDKDPAVRARAFKAVGELGLSSFLPDLRVNFQDENPKCRFYAAWSAALLGDHFAVHALKQLAVQPGHYAIAASNLAVRLMELDNAHDWLRRISRQPGRLRQAISGYGALGDPLAVPWLIEIMQVPELARLAGESFAMITGVDIAYEDLEGEQPEGFEAGPTEDPQDESVDLDPDEELAWPNPNLIKMWWVSNENRFQKEVRHIGGKTISRENCLHILKDGYQRQRAAAAIELSILNPGRPLFETRAAGFQQQRILGLA